MSTTELHHLSVAELAAQLKNKHVSAVEAAQHFLARAQAHQNLGAFVAIDEATTLAQAKAAGQPVLLDWYADWCISCKVIEREVLTAPQVQAQLAGFKLLRFDITESNADQRSLLDRYQLFGPPALLFFAANGSEITADRVIGEINAGEFAQILTRVRDKVGL